MIMLKEGVVVQHIVQVIDQLWRKLSFDSEIENNWVRDYNYMAYKKNRIGEDYNWYKQTTLCGRESENNLPLLSKIIFLP